MLPRKPPSSVAHEADRGPEAADEVLALLAHPVGHEDRHGVAEGPADGREGDAGVAARRLDDRRARLEDPPLVAAAEDMIGHPVLDAAGHVEVLGLGIEDAALPSMLKSMASRGVLPIQCPSPFKRALRMSSVVMASLL